MDGGNATGQSGKIDFGTPDMNTSLDFKINEPLGKITMRNLMTHTPGWEEVARDTLVAKVSNCQASTISLVNR